MKHLLISITTLFLMVGCTFSPLPFEDDATSQTVNTTLVCAKQIDVYQLSINGIKLPKASFDLYLKKLKKYTTDNVIVHETVNLSLDEKDVNYFVQKYGHEGGYKTTSTNLLSSEDSLKFTKFVNETEKKDSAIVMIYTPELLCSRDNHQLRGIAFTHSDRVNIVAFNGPTINHAPVISDTQAWKIVLTHEVGHRLGVPAKIDHNKAGHCTSRECVMYARPDTKAVLSVLFHGMPYDFCDKCKAELREAKKSCESGAYIHYETVNIDTDNIKQK